MHAVELILRKKRGEELSADELRFLVHGYTRGELPDYQLSAWLMAVCWRGMTPRETADYARAMIDSGGRFDLRDVPGLKVDKHSTGGVGDKVSLPLVPIVAAAGLRVPMMSGRGLGHTGGTLDKLESIAGFNVRLDAATAARVLRDTGAFMIGQTADTAPADGKLYALRDVTGTVDSIPLICGSILSKKVAAGVQALVMDVKTGSGAFMPTLDAARDLARELVQIGRELGLQMLALITDMDQPLGAAVGNAIEVRETIDCLRGAGPADLRALTLRIAGEMIRMSRPGAGLAECVSEATQLLDSGAALAKWRELIAAHGGEVRVVDDPELHLPLAPDVEEVVAARAGVVVAFDNRAVGLAANALGAGRETVADTIDHGVGLTVLRKKGDRVDAGEPLVRVHHRAGRGLDDALALLRAAIRIGDVAPAMSPRDLVFEVVER
ncbi:MAG: thymidine phosphorylase [Planctomycetota bacterium]